MRNFVNSNCHTVNHCCINSLQLFILLYTNGYACSLHFIRDWRDIWTDFYVFCLYFNNLYFYREIYISVNSENKFKCIKLLLKFGNITGLGLFWHTVYLFLPQQIVLDYCNTTLVCV